MFPRKDQDFGKCESSERWWSASETQSLLFKSLGRGPRTVSLKLFPFSGWVKAAAAEEMEESASWAQESTRPWPDFKDGLR